MYEYRCAIIRLIDADTAHLNVDLGCDAHLLLTVRLAGIDAPEMSTQAGKDAKAAASQWIKDGTGFVLHTTKDKRERYGRYLGTIYRAYDDVSLNRYLLNTGHAVTYDGGPR